MAETSAPEMSEPSPGDENENDMTDQQLNNIAAVIDANNFKPVKEASPINQPVK